MGGGVVDFAWGLDVVAKEAETDKTLTLTDDQKRVFVVKRAEIQGRSVAGGGTHRKRDKYFFGSGFVVAESVDFGASWTTLIGSGASLEVAARVWFEKGLLMTAAYPAPAVGGGSSGDEAVLGLVDEMETFAAKSLIGGARDYIGTSYQERQLGLYVFHDLPKMEDQDDASIENPQERQSLSPGGASASLSAQQSAQDNPPQGGGLLKSLLRFASVRFPALLQQIMGSFSDRGRADGAGRNRRWRRVRISSSEAEQLTTVTEVQLTQIRVLSVQPGTAFLLLPPVVETDTFPTVYSLTEGSDLNRSFTALATNGRPQFSDFGSGRLLASRGGDLFGDGSGPQSLAGVAEAENEDGISPGQTFFSADSGETWQPCRMEQSAKNVKTKIFLRTWKHGGAPGLVLAEGTTTNNNLPVPTDRPALFVSRDAGASWQLSLSADGFFAADRKTLLFDILAGGDLLVAVLGPRVQISTDQGLTWRAFVLPPGAGARNMIRGVFTHPQHRSGILYVDSFRSTIQRVDLGAAIFGTGGAGRAGEGPLPNYSEFLLPCGDSELELWHPTKTCHLGTRAAFQRRKRDAKCRSAEEPAPELRTLSSLHQVSVSPNGGIDAAQFAPLLHRSSADVRLHVEAPVDEPSIVAQGLSAAFHSSSSSGRTPTKHAQSGFTAIVERCVCSAADYVCDHGFRREGKYCVPLPGRAVDHIEKLCAQQPFWRTHVQVSRGYAKMVGNACINDNNVRTSRFEPAVELCSAAVAPSSSWNTDENVFMEYGGRAGRFVYHLYALHRFAFCGVAMLMLFISWLCCELLTLGMRGLLGGKALEDEDELVRADSIEFSVRRKDGGRGHSVVRTGYGSGDDGMGDEEWGLLRRTNPRRTRFQGNN